MTKRAARYRWVGIVGALVLMGLLAGKAEASGAFDYQRHLEPALAKITGIGGGKVWLATGFAWQQRDWVVTSLHVMRPGATYQVTLPGDGRSWEAVPLRHLTDQDLVLLELRYRGQKLAESEKPDWRPFTSFGRAPDPGEAIYGMGYYEDTPEARNFRLEVESSSVLKDKIPSRHTKKIRAAKIPSASLEVLHFNLSSLLPGYSGAPLVDENGTLVAIGDGGLEQGAIDISWGIPADNLRRLDAAPDGLPAPADLRSASQLYSFAYTDTGSLREPLEYGPFEFVYKKTRTYKEMRETSDNPRAFDARFADDAPAGMDFSLLKYDIYQDLNHGLVIVVPANHGLRVNARNQLEAQGVEEVRIVYEARQSPEETRGLLAAGDVVEALKEKVAGIHGLSRDDLEELGSCHRSRDGNGVLATIEAILLDPARRSERGWVGTHYSKVAIRDSVFLTAGATLALSSSSDPQTQEEARDFVREGTDHPTDEEVQQAADDYARALPFCATEEEKRVQPRICGQADLDPEYVGWCAVRSVRSSVFFTTFSNFHAADQDCSGAHAATAAHPELKEFNLNTRYKANDRATFERASQLEPVADLEVFVEGGELMVASVHQPLSARTCSRIGLPFDAFRSEIQEANQKGYKLRDVEANWTGEMLRYSGVFEPMDYGTKTTGTTYQNWTELESGFQQQQQAGWTLIDLEIPGRGILALYGEGAGPSAYRTGGWAEIQAYSKELAQQGLYLTDLETFWGGETRKFLGVYSQASGPVAMWVGEWGALDRQWESFLREGMYLDDLEVFHKDGKRWALGVFRDCGSRPCWRGEPGVLNE